MDADLGIRSSTLGLHSLHAREYGNFTVSFLTNQSIDASVRISPLILPLPTRFGAKFSLKSLTSVGNCIGELLWSSILVRTIEMDLREAIEKLRDKRQLVRVTGVAALQSLLDNCEKQEFVESAVTEVKVLISSEEWECRQGGFSAARILLHHAKESTFTVEMENLSLQHLEDPEVQVRLAVGECLYALGQEQGSAFLPRVIDHLYKSIEKNLDQSCSNVADKKVKDISNTDHTPENFTQVSSDPSSDPPASSTLKHGNVEGRFLETSLKALHRLIEGCGGGFSMHINHEIWKFLQRTSNHTNRYVRETGFFTLSSLCNVATGEALEQNGICVAEALAVGLGDNWSQVRYAASIATRTFMIRVMSYKHSFYGILLPAMCLNRYYSAEGVRLYSQETWKMVLGEYGKIEVARYIQEFALFYHAQASAKNHQVRETACHCIRELVVKIDRKQVSSVLTDLLVSLMTSYTDLSWPVRDAACSGLISMITEFPEESRQRLPDLYMLWVLNLGDHISSVRENTASALGTAMRTYGLSMVEKVVNTLQHLLQSSKISGEHQPCSPSAQHSSISNFIDNLQTTHVNCLSSHLVDPVHNCTHHVLNESSQSWEWVDGAIYLLRELSNVAAEHATECLPLLSNLAANTDSVKNPHLLETLWRLLPSIAQNVGKKSFKAQLEFFIDPLFRGLSSRQKLVESSSGNCIAQLMTFLGPNIFKARLNESQLAALQVVNWSHVAVRM